MRLPTAGPWSCERNALGELALWDARGNNLLHSEGGALSQEEREANGALAAAAPDLLAALQQIAFAGESTKGMSAIAAATYFQGIAVAAVARFLPKEPLATWYACPTCGCTDIQHEEWIETNTGERTGDPAGTDSWCPQCNDHFSCSVEAPTPKPYQEPLP